MNKKIYWIAGEYSGDAIASKIISALDSLALQNKYLVTHRGVGGIKMLNAGLKLLFSCDELSIMGFGEVIKKLIHLRKLIYKTVNDIENFNPEILITVDSPTFCNRIIDILRHRNKLPKLRYIHVVAPSVWAWRPKRAAKLGRRIHHLLCLMPFEPPYFTCHGLNTTFMGHPLIEEFGDNDLLKTSLTKSLDLDEKLKYQKEIIDGYESSLTCLLLGSRNQELSSHLNLFKKLTIKFPEKKFVIPTLPKYKNILSKCFPNALIVCDHNLKLYSMLSSQQAIAVSGTITLELALARVPSICVYRMSTLNATLARLFIDTPFISLPNILLQGKYVPEFLQERCTEKNVGELLINGTIQQQDHTF